MACRDHRPDPFEELLAITGDAFAYDMTEGDLMMVFADCVLMIGEERMARSPASFEALSRCLVDTPSFSDLWMCRGVD